MHVCEHIKEFGLQSLLDITKVKATRHPEFPNLVFLKYDQIESPKGCKLTQQCRGLILDENDDWSVISYPYNRFFNHGEGHAAEIDWSSARIYEKLDGSLVTLYYYKGDWHVASNGHPSAGGQVENNKDKTFADLFWQVWEEKGYELPKLTYYCYVFELMTPENRIVVPHKENKLILHGVRELSHYLSYPEKDPAEYAETWNPEWEYVKTYPFANANEVIKAASELQGIQSEGFVVCDRNFNRIKIKSASYVALHHLRSSFSTRRMVELIQSGEGEEFLTYFPEFADMYAKMQGKYNELVNQAESVYKDHASIESQKDFASAVKDRPYAGVLFGVRARKIASIAEGFKAFDSRRLLALLGYDTSEGL